MVVDASGTEPKRAGGRREWAGSNFRVPSAADPPPAARHLARICAWAAVVGLAGTLAAVRAFIGLIFQPPGWHLPVLVLIGLVGMASTIGAFASVHRQRLPMILLGVASASVVAAWFVTGI
jgi:uncharacterized RDD family membrane protein YckC